MHSNWSVWYTSQVVPSVCHDILVFLTHHAISRMFHPFFSVNVLGWKKIVDVRDKIVSTQISYSMGGYQSLSYNLPVLVQPIPTTNSYSTNPYPTNSCSTNPIPVLYQSLFYECLYYQSLCYGPDSYQSMFYQSLSNQSLLHQTRMLNLSSKIFVSKQVFVWIQKIGNSIV